MGSKTTSFRVGRVRAYRRGQVWYLAYSEQGRRRQPRVGPDRDAAAREQEVARIAKDVEVGLNSLIDRQNGQLAEFFNRQIEGQTVPGLDGLISQAERHLDELFSRAYAAGGPNS